MTNDNDAATSFAVAFILMLFPTSLHSVGLHILYVASNTTDFHRLHLILLSTVSATSICSSLSNFTRITLTIFGNTQDEATTTILYIFTVLSYVLLYTFYITVLCLITVDRFLLFHYKLRYTTVWTTKKLKASIAGNLTVSCIVFLIFCSVFWNDMTAVEQHVGLVYWPILEYIFLLVNAIAFTYIAVRRTTVHADTSTAGDRNSRSVSTVLSRIDLQRLQHENNKRKTVFFLFLSSFFLLSFLPDQLFFVKTIKGDNIYVSYYIISSAMFSVHLSGNAILYLVTSKKLRRIWMRVYCSKVTSCLFVKRRNRVSSTATELTQSS